MTPAYGTTAVGLRLNATNRDGLSPGCYCEGWGVGDSASGVSGWAWEARGYWAMTPINPATSATSVVDIANMFTVTHAFTPSEFRGRLLEDAVRALEALQPAP